MEFYIFGNGRLYEKEFRFVIETDLNDRKLNYPFYKINSNEFNLFDRELIHEMIIKVVFKDRTEIYKLDRRLYHVWKLMKLKIDKDFVLNLKSLYYIGDDVDGGLRK